MKKFLKTLAVFSAAIPVAALSACNALAPVNNDDKSAVYGQYADRFVASLEQLQTGTSFFNVYESELFTVHVGDNSAHLVSRGDADIDFKDGVSSRYALTNNAEIIAVAGDVEQSQTRGETAYLLADGLYLARTDSEVETGNVKSFTALESVDPNRLITLETIFAGASDFSSAEEFFALYGEGEWLAKEDGTQIQIKVQRQAFDRSFYQLMLSAMGTDQLNVVIEETFTLVFDKQGNLSYVEREVTANVKIAPPQADDEQGGTENGDAAPTSEEVPDDLPDDETGEVPNEEQAPATPTGEGYYRYYTKLSVKEGSTAKFPTQAELNSYKQAATPPAENPEETPEEPPKQ